jgi:catechol 2,3-dioxygenase-like lactoylglutathione lyase family enzyme
MSFSHLAFATKDLRSTHRFYSEAVGLGLVHVEIGDLPDGGWFRHIFYDVGGGELLAFFDLHTDAIGDYGTAISTGLGLPSWVNHVALHADSVHEIDARKERLLTYGHDCAVVDHGVAISLYVEDPNGITIEFCHPLTEITTDAESRQRAAILLEQARPTSTGTPPIMKFYGAIHATE